MLSVPAERMQGIEVRVCSTSGDCQLCGSAPPTAKSAWATVQCPGDGLVGTYLDLINRNNYLQFCEIEVFGSGL